MEIPNNNIESSREREKNFTIFIQDNNNVQNIDWLGDAVPLTTGNSTAEEAWTCDVGATVAL